MQMQKWSKLKKSKLKIRNFVLQRYNNIINNEKIT